MAAPPKSGHACLTSHFIMVFILTLCLTDSEAQQIRTFRYVLEISGTGHHDTAILDGLAAVEYLVVGVLDIPFFNEFIRSYDHSI